MKYYSENTRKFYDSEQECAQAEIEYSKKLAAEKAKKEELSNTRKERAKEIEDAYKAILEAKQNYSKLLSAFVKDYGSFHMTLRTGDGNPFDSFYSIIDRFW
jgi:hypothetical protein